jgi:nucleotide-binding universal stress UspA family protein
MITIRTILCPVDFSPAAARQVDLASQLCLKFNARLVLHHNLTALAVGAAVGWMWAADHRPLSEEAVRRNLDDLAKSRTAIDVETRITQGPSSAAVLAVSEAVAADLVVLSTHSTAPDDHNSITELVLGAGERSVLALHDAGGDHHALCFDQSLDHRQVTLVPANLTDNSRAAVNFAFELAQTLPLEIHLLHLVRNHHVLAGAEEQLQALVPADCAGYSSVHVRVGDPAEGIVKWANDLSAECVIMGEHTHGSLRRWFSRDTSRAVLHAAPCPVWYVPGQRAA